MYKLISIVFFLSFSLIFLGCGNSLENKKVTHIEKDIKPLEAEGVISQNFLKPKNKKNRSFTPIEQNKIRIDGLNYLNELRNNAGMTTYSRETNLDDAAYNHAHYLMLNNTLGHYESSGNPGFTGAIPSDRVEAAGYLHRNVGENLSVGTNSVQESIDVLFSAIYHRFGFLDFNYDEIGIGADSITYGHVYNYNMGISQIRTLCENESFTGSSSYYSNICKDSSLLIDTSVFDSAINQNINKNPNVVVWPYAGQTDSMPVFYEESPDPLPNCSVSGYPISVQFNDLKSGSIDMQSFKLYYEHNNSEIINTRLLDQNTDPNNRFSKKQFALFPMQRLSWNTKYKVEIKYLEDNIQKTKSWNFKTRALSGPYYEVTTDNMTFDVKKSQTYYFYIPPSNCNDRLSSVNYSGYMSLDYIDQNTVKIKVKQDSGTCQVYFNGGKSFTLNISNSDSAIYPDNAKKQKTITLKENWNLLGTNANLTLNELKEKLGKNNLLVVQGGNLVYKKSNPAVINDFSAFEHGYGYWVKVEKETELKYTPITYENRIIQLSSGWNLINPIKNLTLTEIKEQVGSNNLEVIQGGEAIYKKSNPPMLNDFTQFKEPYGYWVKVISDSNLEF